MSHTGENESNVCPPSTCPYFLGDVIPSASSTAYCEPFQSYYTARWYNGHKAGHRCWPWHGVAIHAFLIRYMHAKYPFVNILFLVNTPTACAPKSSQQPPPPPVTSASLSACQVRTSSCLRRYSLSDPGIGQTCNGPQWWAQA